MQCGEARHENIMHGPPAMRYRDGFRQGFTSMQFNASIYPAARSRDRGAAPRGAATSNPDDNVNFLSGGVHGNEDD